MTKIRDSGMPDEAYWESLFDVPLILSRLNIGRFHDIAELGCGYGTFTIPIARLVSGTVYTYEIDRAMIDRTEERLTAAGIDNVVCCERDVVEYGFGLHEIDAVLLFNILHCDDPGRLLTLSADAVRENGALYVIHWRFDSSTPRGPSLEIRPRPEQIIDWARQVGWVEQGNAIDLPPWHFGIVFALRSFSKNVQ